MFPIRSRSWWLLVLTSALLSPAAFAASAQKPIPVIFDTDIGTDIDDAYALALVIQSPELELLGVTTVSGDAVARARLAAKLLAVAGPRWANVPVYAGTSTAEQYMKQVEWAAGFKSSALHASGGVEFMRQQINARPGEITIIAVGELTNVAALLAAEPTLAPKIKAIALMGGALRSGYAPGSKPEPEWNIRCNAAAAQAVFTSGVPLLVAPLDSTTALRLAPEWKVRLFTKGTPLLDALAALDFVWHHTNHWKANSPTLFDALPISLLYDPTLARLESLHVVVDANGLTREVPGEKPNSQVALEADPEKYLEHFVRRLTAGD